MQPSEKLTQLPSYSSPGSASDIFPIVDITNTVTKKITLSALNTYFFTQTNIPSGGGSPVTRQSETMYDFVASGGVWSGDSYGTNRNASMTAMVCYINGRRISISAVTSRTFTASKDTYIDILDNADGTGTLVYTEVSNNAASPTLAASSLRIGIIITGASTIADAGSVNQGQETKILPIASSVAYSVSDSLGNRICPRDPNRRLLGYRQITSAFTTASASYTDVTGLSCPVNIPTSRRVAIFIGGNYITQNSAAGVGVSLSIQDSTASATLQELSQTVPGTSYAMNPCFDTIYTPPASGARTFKAQGKAGSNTLTFNATATAPAFIRVELV